MKKKISILIIGLIIILTSLGLSYAYWKITLMGDKGNNVTSGCFNIEMINQKDEITLGSTFPITDAEGLKLKPFSFTLKNTCTIFAHYYVNMEMLEGTTLNSRFVAVRVNNEAINTLDTYKVASTTINTSTESRTIAEGYLGADEEVDYTVSFWMDEDATIDDDVMNKVFKSKIVINSEPGKYDPVSAGYDTLHDAILANEYQTTPEIAKNKIANKQEVDLSQTAPVIKWVEKTDNKSSVIISKPSASVIQAYNKDVGTDDRMTQASDLTLNDTKIKLYTKKTFDTATGKYLISEPIYIDPTTINYNDESEYYFKYEYISYNKTTGKLRTVSENEDSIIGKVIGSSKTTGSTTWNDVSYDSISYKIDMVILNGAELELDKSDKGLYQAIDDYGTTYYYRGNVKNNNVYFAGFYWQIVRINGDESIRMIYDGTIKNASGKQQSINNATYQFNDMYDKPVYIGYMYGNPDGTKFDEVHTNIKSSTIKIIIDSWYKINIEDKGFNTYISNVVGFCGDRTIYNDGDGIQTNKNTYFGAYGRYEKNAAQFTCQEPTRDLYTTTYSSTGNKALTYPIGLITYDELVFAGMNNNRINKLSWIYSSEQYWTLSPSGYSSLYGTSTMWSQNNNGSLNAWTDTQNVIGLRPVINLKSDVKITGGTGTANDPFVVDTNN